jgi:hypothetical protein
VDDEFEKMWKEAIMVYFRFISWHLPGNTKKKKNSRELVSGQRYEPKTL